MQDYHAILKPLFQSKDIDLLSATESNVETIEGELMRNICMSLAEYERGTVAIRTMAGLRQKAEQGCFPGKAPYGYKNISLENGNKTIVIDDTYAFYIRRAFELYATGHYSLRNLNEQLYKDGFRTKSGKKIYRTAIEAMLKNIFYTGVFEFEGKVYENACHKPIISKELFYRVQEKLRDPKKSRSHTIQFSYTGLMTCGHCGCFLTGELKKGKYIYYHCTGNRGGTCKKDYTRQEKIDKTISEILRYVVIPYETKIKLKEALKSFHLTQSNYSTETKGSVKMKIARLDTYIDNAYMDKLDNNITHEEWKKKDTKWRAERDKLYIRLKEIDKINEQFKEKSNTILDFCEDAHNLFLNGSIDQKRRIVKIVCSNLIYKDKELSIELNSVFKTLVENAYLLKHGKMSNRTPQKSVTQEIEPCNDAILINGSPGWTRTNNLPVNSRLLRH